MVRKGDLANFGGNNISKTRNPTLAKIGVHALHIHSYLHEFFESILID